MYISNVLVLSFVLNGFHSETRSRAIHMCGILGVFDSKMSCEQLRLKTLTLQRLVRHRGPDGSGIHVACNSHLSAIAHERLAIVDPLSGNQPLFSQNDKLALTVNGEIYNHETLKNDLNDVEFRTKSDCEVIVHLYEKFGVEVASKLDGDFAFCIVDDDTGHMYAARDPIGVNSMYLGTGMDGSTWFASEAKALMKAGCVTVNIFPPGHYWTSETNTFTKYYNPSWLEQGKSNAVYEKQLLKTTLIQAVKKRLMTDVPYGVLLSGGLDSSLIASIITRVQRENFLVNGDSSYVKRLKSFSIGLPGSPDLNAAYEVAKFLGTEHYGFTFTIQEGIDAISDVIFHLETYDITTIRAGTPMFLLSRKIKSMGIKMVLSGEGADEIFGGYLYFHKAPNASEFHDECIRKVQDLHVYDCLRANKATMANGLEVRVPFLDSKMLDIAMTIDAKYKMSDTRIEKYILRDAFDDKELSFLPDEVLWRQKEQFSDGVGYSWINALQEHAEKVVNDDDVKSAALRFPHNTPVTKEGMYYRKIFHSHFPNNNYGNGIESTVKGGPSVACSTEKAISWDVSWSNISRQDQSGRMVDSHINSKM